MVTNSKGEEAEFNEEGKYDAETRKEIEELKGALGMVNSDTSICERCDIVEEEIREAIKKSNSAVAIIKFYKHLIIHSILMPRSHNLALHR